VVAADEPRAGQSDEDDEDSSSGSMDRRDVRPERHAHHDEGMLAIALPANMSQAVKALRGESKKVEDSALPEGVRPGTICHGNTWDEPLKIYWNGHEIGAIETMDLLSCNDGYWELAYRGYLYTWSLRDWRWRATFYNRYGYAVAYISSPTIDLFSGPIDVHQTGTERTLSMHFPEIESVGRAGRGYLQ
jgi:hypothetical protein